MARRGTKTALMSFRVAPEIRAALEKAAAHERRSLTNMLEVIVLEWARQHAVEDEPRAANSTKAGR